MDIYIYNNRLKKESNDIQRAITNSMNNLSRRIEAYRENGVSFENIYNDDKVKYDKHGNLYTFKDQKNNVQIRLLYSYTTINNKPALIIVDYYVKKKNNKQYINMFKLASDKLTAEIINNAVYFQSVC